MFVRSIGKLQICIPILILLQTSDALQPNSIYLTLLPMPYEIT